MFNTANCRIMFKNTLKSCIIKQVSKKDAGGKYGKK